MSESISSEALCNIIFDLNPGTSVDHVLINGNKQSVDTFASFNPTTGIATFVKENKDILVVDCLKIDAIVFN